MVSDVYADKCRLVEATIRGDIHRYYIFKKSQLFSKWRFQHANAPPAKLKNIFVKTLKRGTKI